MSKEQFLKQLRQHIHKLPKDEQVEIMQDYEEYFAMGALDGKNEEAMAKALGHPKTIAKELVANYRIEEVEKNGTLGNFLKATWMVIGLGFFNLLIVLGPFLVVASLVLAVWLLGVGLIAAPLLLFVNIVIYPEVFQFFDLFNALLFCGVGILIAVGAFYITKRCISGFTRYLKFNTKLVKGGGKYVES